MYNFKEILAFYLETAMHPGTGSVINAIVDLPIQRESTTTLPFIQSSTIKGNLRDLCKENYSWEDKHLKIIFGEGDSRGSISITDAKLLLFPVRSIDRIFCWITCPLILQRFLRDLELINKEVTSKIPIISEFNKAVSFSAKDKDKSLNLENYIFKIESNEDDQIFNNILTLFPSIKTFTYLIERLKNNLFILDDTIFKRIVNTETEIVPRIKINQKTGTTETGALFYEEYLPKDTLLYSTIFFNDDSSNTLKNKLSELDNKIIQLGSNFTIGKGITTMKLVNGV